jgi:hypothetical protein
MGIFVLTGNTSMKNLRMSMMKKTITAIAACYVLLHDDSPPDAREEAIVQRALQCFHVVE